MVGVSCCDKAIRRSKSTACHRPVAEPCACGNRAADCPRPHNRQSSEVRGSKGAATCSPSLWTVTARLFHLAPPPHSPAPV